MIRRVRCESRVLKDGERRRQVSNAGWRHALTKAFVGYARKVGDRIERSGAFNLFRKRGAIRADTNRYGCVPRPAVRPLSALVATSSRLMSQDSWLKPE